MPSSSPAQRLAHLDGLRGWGALSVVLLHTFILGFPLREDITPWLRQIPLFHGSLAVWVFFIVSGFSLSIGFLERQDRPAVARVAIGRYLRLAVPIALVTLVFWAIAACGLVPPPAARPKLWATQLADGFGLAQALRFGFIDAFSTAFQPVNPPVWSMRYELLGSFIVLGLLLAMGMRQARFNAYAIVGLVAFVVHPMWATFVVGVLLAELHAGNLPFRRESVARAAGLLVIPVLLALTQLPYDPERANLFFVAAVALTFCMLFSPACVRFLGNRASRFLGRISFPLYLVHTGVFLVYTLNVTGPGDHGLAARVAIDVSTVVVAILVAWLLVPADRAGILAGRAAGAWVLRPATLTPPTPR